MKRFKFIALFFLLAGIAGCGKVRDTQIIHDGGNFELENNAGTKFPLQIKFLGTASFLLSYNGESVLTDPFVSNPPFRKVTFGKLQTDSALVNEFISAEELKSIKAVTVGHAHYDHLMDLPYMSQKMNKEVLVCGSQTMCHTLAPFDVPLQLLPLNASMATEQEEGSWVYTADSSIRILPIQCEHPPHIGRHNIAHGKREKDLTDFPIKSKHWLDGQTLSYLIDFMQEGGQIAYRVFFQSSAYEPPLCLYPNILNQQKKVDATIVSTALLEEKDAMPEAVIDYTDAEVVILCHWENFFRHKHKPLKFVGRSEVEPIYRAMKKRYEGEKEVFLPRPGAEFQLQ